MSFEESLYSIEFLLGNRCEKEIASEEGVRPHKSTSGILSLPSDIETGGRENGGGGENEIGA